MLPEVSLDYETVSAADLRAVGAWEYAHHPSTAIRCCGYRIADGRETLWWPNDPDPVWKKKPNDFSFRAFNSFFEYAVWHALWGDPPPLENWSDTMAEAAALALPMSLGELSDVFGLGNSGKDKRGKELIQLCCIVRDGIELQPGAGLLEELGDYCKQDVVAETAVKDRVRRLKGIEKNVWVLDQKINVRGIPVDRKSAERALELSRIESELFDEKARELSNGAISSAKAAKLKNFCWDEFYFIPNLKKETVNEWIPHTHGRVRELLELRLSANQTSTAKFKSFLAMLGADNRIRGVLRYHRASTGRWGGSGPQPHNLPSRDIYPDPEDILELLPYADAIDQIRKKYPDILKAFKSILRPMICAPEGSRLIVADYNAIEARVLAWLANEQSVLDVFERGEDIYLHIASSISGANRDVGKVCQLAFGFGGGKAAFQRFAPGMGVEVTDEEAERIKVQWRGSNPYIVKYWSTLQKDAHRTLASGKPHGIFRVKSGYLLARLPSGRDLAYANARLGYQPAPWDEEQMLQTIKYQGMTSLEGARRWGTQTTYGAKICENVVQAVARDLLAEAMLRLDAAGYKIIMHVHDEIVCEMPNGEGSIDEMIKIMCQPTDWSGDLPIKAAGFESKRFKK